MNNDERIIDLLGRIESNQRTALEAQQRHLEIAQAQLDRSNKTIQESIELQRTAVARQGQITRIILPLLAVVVALLAYLLFKYRIF